MHKNSKEWAKTIVAEKHDYLSAENISSQVNMHKNVAEHVNKFYANKSHIKLVDFGCGNGRLYNTLTTELKMSIDYIGTDINLSVLSFAKSFFVKESNVSFFYCDFDKIPIVFNPVDSREQSIFLSESNVDVCVFDSTINMADSPDLLLENICKYVPLIVMSRVKIGGNLEKGSYMWDGMTSSSTNWQFTKDYFFDLAKAFNKTCEINGNNVVLKSL